MTETWAQTHARENPGHVTTESIFLPPWCETCEAKSPAWGMEKAEVPSFEETLALIEDLAKRYSSPPLPSRIDVSASVLEVLKRKAAQHRDEERLIGSPPLPGSLPLFGIPVVLDESLAPGEWKIVPRDEHKHP